MVLDIVITLTDDGVTAEIPSLKGCESWGHSEEKALENIIELARYYLKLPESAKMKTDRARITQTGRVYKLIFDNHD